MRAHFLTRLVGITGNKCVLLLHPDYAQRVLMDREKNFSIKMGWESVMAEFFQGGLVMRDYDEHRIHRGIMNSSFKPPAMRARQIMEKPFGIDLASAVSLNVRLHEVFVEEQIFRIDHFLGKEPVQNLMVFRFANSILEPVWNRNYVRSVQVTMSETIPTTSRAATVPPVGSSAGRPSSISTTVR